MSVVVVRATWPLAPSTPQHEDVLESSTVPEVWLHGRGRPHQGLDECGIHFNIVMRKVIVWHCTRRA